MPSTTFACEGGDSIVVAIGPRYARAAPAPRPHRTAVPRAHRVGGELQRRALHAPHQGDEALLERGGDVILRGCRSGTAAAPLGLTADSAPSPARARAVSDSIDSLTVTLTPVTRKLVAGSAGQGPTGALLWADSGRPVKLSVTEPSVTGGTAGLTSYYFVDGRLEVVQGPVSQYLFRDTTLILWTTDSLHQGAEIPLRDMVARQNFVLGEVRQYLAMFGVEQEGRAPMSHFLGLRTAIVHREASRRGQGLVHGTCSASARISTSRSMWDSMWAGLRARHRA